MWHNWNCVTLFFQFYTNNTNSYVMLTQLKLYDTIEIMRQNWNCVTQLKLCHTIEKFHYTLYTGKVHTYLINHARSRQRSSREKNWSATSHTIWFILRMWKLVMRNCALQWTLSVHSTITDIFILDARNSTISVTCYTTFSCLALAPTIHICT